MEPAPFLLVRHPIENPNYRCTGAEIRSVGGRKMPDLIVYQEAFPANLL
jgi:hypothetical protein